jgi:hypothetical protein
VVGTAAAAEMEVGATAVAMAVARVAALVGLGAEGSEVGLMADAVVEEVRSEEVRAAAAARPAMHCPRA